MRLPHTHSGKHTEIGDSPFSQKMKICSGLAGSATFNHDVTQTGIVAKQHNNHQMRMNKSKFYA